MQFDMTRYWYRPSLHFLTACLLPFTALFAAIVFVRKKLFEWNILKKKKFHCPVIVVGNITVGGTGKTPFVMWLAQFLKRKGYEPGIVSRGVGGQQLKLPHWVKSEDSVEKVGDESLVI